MTQKTMPVFDESFRQTLIELFNWRRDVRSFLPDPVPLDLLDALFRTAALAPSVGLSQPWQFIMVNDETRRAAVRRNFEQCNAKALSFQPECRADLYAKLKLSGLHEAPVQFAVCNETRPLQGHGLGRQTMPEMTQYSTVMAVHTLWLLARAMGLGLGWVSILDPQAVLKTLDISGNLELIGYFCLGYPALSSEIPELERLGWEERSLGTKVIHR